MVSKQGEVLWQASNSFLEEDTEYTATYMLLTDQGELVVRDMFAVKFCTPGDLANETATLYVYGIMPDDPRHARAGYRAGAAF